MALTAFANQNATRERRTRELMNRLRPAEKPALRVVEAPREFGVADRLEIDALLTEYAWMADHGMFADVASLFADGAVLTVGGREVTGGTAAIATWAQAQAVKMSKRTQHQVSNVWITATGPDAATATAALVVHAAKDGRRSTYVDYVGEFQNEYVRTPAGWRISRMRLVHLADA